MKNLIIILFSLFSCVSVAQELPELEKYTLKNGVKIYLMPYGKIPAVSIKFVINTGDKNETPGQQGYSNITASLLLEGNTKYTQQQQNDIAFKLGGSLNSGSGKDYTTVSATFLTKDIDTGMDLFSSAILHPSFKKEKLDQMISYLIDYNNPNKMDVSNLTNVYSNLFIYGTSNPLGRNYYKAQLKLITPEKIKEFHDFNYTPKNSSIIVCGKFNSADVKLILEKYFGAWESAYGEVNGVALDKPQIKDREVAFINRSSASQCALQWSKIGPSLKDKDLLAFNVANRIFNVVLFSEIREKGGKTYSIGSGHQASQFSNLIVISCSVRSDEMLNTINLFDKTLTNFSLATFSKEDYDKAVTALKISLMSSEAPETISSIYNPILYDFNKRKNYMKDLNLVTMEDVQKVIKKYFKPEVYKLVVAGDESLVSKQLKEIKGLTRFKASDIEKDN